MSHLRKEEKEKENYLDDDYNDDDLVDLRGNGDLTLISCTLQRLLD